MTKIASIIAATLISSIASAAMAQATTRPTTLPSQVFNWDALKVQTTANGQRRDLARMETATLSELEMHITTLNPGEQSHPPHQHANEEVIFLKEGTAEATINGKVIPMPTGSILYVEPWDFHNIRNTGPGPCTYFVVAWKTPKTGAP